jgi:hypothetical protein
MLKRGVPIGLRGAAFCSTSGEGGQARRGMWPSSARHGVVGLTKNTVPASPVASPSGRSAPIRSGNRLIEPFADFPALLPMSDSQSALKTAATGIDKKYPFPLPK